MRIHLTTDHAIRIVVYLATVHDTRSAKDIAAHVGISSVNVVRVAQKLLEEDVLESQRGKTGGYLLAVSPESFTLLDVVEIMEGQSIFGSDESADREYFPKAVFEKMHDHIDRMLESVTIDQLARESLASSMAEARASARADARLTKRFLPGRELPAS